MEACTEQVDHTLHCKSFTCEPWYQDAGCESSVGGGQTWRPIQLTGLNLTVSLSKCLTFGKLLSFLLASVFLSVKWGIIKMPSSWES